MLNSSNLLIPLQKTDETSHYSIMNLKSLQLALPFPINSVQRPPRLVLHFMIHETAFYIIFFQGLTLLIKISKIHHEGTELESPQLLALSQSENVLQIYKEFEKQLELAGPNKHELLRSIYFILIIYLRKKYRVEGQQLTLPWNFELEATDSKKALGYVSKLALPFEQKKSITYQRVLALDYDKMSARYSGRGISSVHPSKTIGVPASIPLKYGPAKPVSNDASYVSITRQLNSLGQENKYQLVPYNPIVIPTIKKTQRKYSCDDQILYENPLACQTKLVVAKKESKEAKVITSLPTPQLRIESSQLQSLVRKLNMEAPLLKTVEPKNTGRLIKLFSNILEIHSQKLLSAINTKTNTNPVKEESRNLKSSIPNYLVQKRLPALTYEPIKCICYPTQVRSEAPAPAGTTQMEAAPAQSVTRKAASSNEKRKCLTYESKLAIGYQPRLALTYNTKLAITYSPVLAIQYLPEVCSPSNVDICNDDDEYEIVTKQVVDDEITGQRVEIEDEEYLTQSVEVASCKEDIEEVDFQLEEEEYYSKEDVVYFTDKDLDEIDFEELVYIGNDHEDNLESLPAKPHLEDFVIVDAA